MKKLLFINSCIRENSRTEKLAREFLAKKYEEYDIKEVVLKTLDIKPLTENDIILRDKDISKNCFDRYLLARDFASADEIVIAAPFWDSSFPSLLKVYIENICVNNLTFSYDEKGVPKKLCKANRLVYVTTAGGFVSENPSVKIYLRELCDMFAIPKLDFYCAQGLDVFPDRADEILKNKLEEILK